MQNKRAFIIFLSKVNARIVRHGQKKCHGSIKARNVGTNYEYEQKLVFIN